MRGDGLARAQERALRAEEKQFGDALKDAVRNHCRKTQAPDYHYEACLSDLRRQPKETWPYWLSYFKGEIA